eukprot:GDKI01041363.1.p1 GENE.GDKI01041363.1~~GDKI01041363.1.p1  ORF type:complete len:201 (+),score=70.61 GDKI01041363.1:67-669(+)
MPSKEEVIEQLGQKIKDFMDKREEEVNARGRIILVAVDNSECSHKAVEWFAKHVKQKEDVLVLMTVWEEFPEYQSGTGIETESFVVARSVPEYPIPGLIMLRREDLHEQNEAAIEEGKKVIQQMYAQHLKDTTVFPLLVATESGAKSALGDAICQAATALHCEMVVIGCRGLGAFKRFFLGSVSKYVVENCHTPVLLVKD